MSIFNVDVKYSHGTSYTKTPYAVDAHIHPYHELVYYIQGEGKSVIGGKSYDYKPNTFAYIPTEMPHEELAETPSTHYLIGFTFNQDIETIPAGLYQDDKELTIYRLLMQIKSELRHTRSYYKVRMDALAQDILITVIRTYLPKKNDDSNNRLEMAVNYLQSYYNKPIDIHNVAETVYYSYDRFRHLFKEYTGVTPQRYLNDLRLTAAKRLLENTNTPIARIAKDVGYSSPSNFIIDFRKAFSVTPFQYRKQPPEYDQTVTFLNQKPQ